MCLSMVYFLSLFPLGKHKGHYFSVVILNCVLQYRLVPALRSSVALAKERSSGDGGNWSRINFLQKFFSTPTRRQALFVPRRLVYRLRLSSPRDPRSQNKNNLNQVVFTARGSTRTRILQILCSVWIFYFASLVKYLKPLFESSRNNLPDYYFVSANKKCT